MSGLVQALQAAASSEHPKVPGSVLDMAIVTLWLSVASGVAVAVVSGAVASIVHVRCCKGPVFPARSVARTARSWLPSARPVQLADASQGCPAAPSSWHSNEAASLLERLNAASFAEVSDPSDGPPPMVTAGGVVSTVHE